LFFFSGRIALIQLEAAMLIQGGTPNPTYVNGTASMGYAVLGGLVEGRTSLSISAGTKCDEENNDPFGGIPFVSSMTPGEKARGKVKKVSVWAKPTISFNNKIGDNLTSIDDIGEIYIFEEPKTKLISKYRVRIKEFKMIELGGPTVLGTPLMLSTTEFQFTPKTYLKPETDYKFEITLVADEWTGTKWQPVMKRDKKSLWTSYDKSYFTTGKLPTSVEFKNLKLCYPDFDYKEVMGGIHEFYYLQGENKIKEGFIEFDRACEYLFKANKDPEAVWWSKVQAQFWYREYGNNIDRWHFLGAKDMISGTGRFLVFKLPENDFPNRTQIRVKFVHQPYINPKFKVEEVQNTDYKGKVGETIRREGKTYTNYPTAAPKATNLFSYSFQTSRYNTFKEKMTTNRHLIAFTQNVRYPEGTFQRLVYQYSFSTKTGESFSNGEMMGSRIGAGKPRMAQYVHMKEDYSSRYYQHLFKNWNILLNNRRYPQFLDKYRRADWNTKSTQEWPHGNYGPQVYDMNTWKTSYFNQSHSRRGYNESGYKLYPRTHIHMGSSVLLNAQISTTHVIATKNTISWGVPSSFISSSNIINHSPKPGSYMNVIAYYSYPRISGNRKSVSYSKPITLKFKVYNNP
jgi:hypothetical protein